MQSQLTARGSIMSGTCGARMAPSRCSTHRQRVSHVDLPVAHRAGRHCSTQDLLCRSAASNAGKTAQEPATMKALGMCFGSGSAPHPAKASYGGEDSFFTSEVGGGAFAVADGVGGWQESGINPADYSKKLMKTMKEFLETRDPSVSTKDALAYAQRKTRLPGSSTVCLVRLRAGESMVDTSNLGDGGFLHLRNGAVQNQAKMQQHFFDCPFQMGAFPEYVEETDTADDASYTSFEVQPGDVFVAASDGLWDNVYESEVAEITAEQPVADAEAAQNLADRLVAKASEISQLEKYESPYVKAALRQGIDLPFHEKLLGAKFEDGKFKLKELSGGKVDDITVVVAAVVETEVPAQAVAADGSSEEQ